MERARKSAFFAECESPPSSHTTGVDEGSTNLAAQAASSFHDAHVAGGLPPSRGLGHGAARDDPMIQDTLDVGMIVANQAVVIEDCYAWRASMPVSIGVRPVKTMEEFAGMEPLARRGVVEKR